VADSGTLRATASKCRGRRRAKSLPRADLGDAEQIGRQVGGCGAMEAAVHGHCQPKRDPLRHPQPLQTAEERRDVDVSSPGTEDQTGCYILYQLESVEQL